MKINRRFTLAVIVSLYVTMAIVSLFILGGCATPMTDEEREVQKYDRIEARLQKAEYKQWCRDVNGILLTDRFGRIECVSREQLRNMMGGWK